jgi:hypothetical protein
MTHHLLVGFRPLDATRKSGPYLLDQKKKKNSTRFLLKNTKETLYKPPQTNI